MPNEIVAALIGLVGALVGGGISSGVTYIISRSERDKFMREKLWEERRASYTSILSCLSACERASAAIHESFTNGPRGSAEDYIKSDAYRADCAKLAGRHASLVQAINTNQFVATDRMGERVDRLTYDIAVIEADATMLPDRAAKQWNCYRHAEEDVLRIGKDDLGIRKKRGAFRMADHTLDSSTELQERAADAN